MIKTSTPLFENEPMLQGAYNALLRAAEDAKKIAIDTNTGIVTMRDNKIVTISADELRKEKKPPL